PSPGARGLAHEERRLPARRLHDPRLAVRPRLRRAPPAVAVSVAGLALFSRLVRVVRAFVARLVGRDGHLLGRDLAGDDREIDFVLVLALDQDRRSRFERAPEHEVGEWILAEALD